MGSKMDDEIFCESCGRRLDDWEDYEHYEGIGYICADCVKDGWLDEYGDDELDVFFTEDDEEDGWVH